MPEEECDICKRTHLVYYDSPIGRLCTSCYRRYELDKKIEAKPPCKKCGESSDGKDVCFSCFVKGLR